MKIKPPRHPTPVAVSALIAVTAMAVMAIRVSGAQPAGLDTATIDRAIGKTGQSSGEIYKVTFPRSDLHVTVDGVAVRPGLALTGWAAFKAVGAEAVTHGDLALAENEVFPVVRKLRAEQLGVTAIHNHLLGESPRVMYVHFWGRGPAARLAGSLKAALDAMGDKTSGMRP